MQFERGHWLGNLSCTNKLTQVTYWNHVFGTCSDFLEFALDSPRTVMQSIILSFWSVCSSVILISGAVEYSNRWSVQIDGGDAEADRLAHKHGFVNLGKVGLCHIALWSSLPWDYKLCSKVRLFCNTSLQYVLGIFHVIKSY